jgi:hypothetical protein
MLIDGDMCFAAYRIPVNALVGLVILLKYPDR